MDAAGRQGGRGVDRGGTQRLQGEAGGVIMPPPMGDMWACWGALTDNEFEHLRIKRG